MSILQAELKAAQDELAKHKEVLQRQMDLFERQKIQLQHSQQQLQLERQQLHQMHAAAIAAGIEGMPTDSRQTRKSGSGSRSDSPVGVKPVPPSSVPQAVWDNVAHKRSSSDELVLNFRSQQGSGDLSYQQGLNHRDPSPKGGGRLQRPQSAGARTNRPLQLAPEANLPIHLMSTTNEQRVGGVSSQHTHHLPMKLASGGSANKGQSGGNKAARSQSLSMPNKLPMKLSVSSSGSNLEARSAHTIPSYTSVMDSSSVVPANVPTSSPPPVSSSQLSMSSSHQHHQQQTISTVPNTSGSTSGHRARMTGPQPGVVNNTNITHPVAMGTKRSLPSTLYSVPGDSSSSGTTPARQMQSFRSQPAMHLGTGGSGLKSGLSGSSGSQQATQPQSILPMKLAQGGSKVKSTKQSPKSPPQVVSPGQKPTLPPKMQQLSSPREGKSLATSGSRTQQHHHGDTIQSGVIPHSHSQQKPKQKHGEEIIYF